jgi:hypothetical protein
VELDGTGGGRLTREEDNHREVEEGSRHRGSIGYAKGHHMHFALSKCITQ